MNIPGDLKYTKDHEWLRIDNGIGTVGITDYAKEELGDIVYLEFPEEGRKVSQNESIGTIEAVKTVADLFAPVGGEIESVNKALIDKPETINRDPYGEGWMLKIKISDPDEINSIMDADAYKKHIADQ